MSQADFWAALVAYVFWALVFLSILSASVETKRDAVVGLIAAAMWPLTLVLLLLVASVAGPVRWWRSLK